MKEQQAIKILLYYFAFPHYRLNILKEIEALSQSFRVKVDFASGIKGRGGIKPIDPKDLPSLRVLQTMALGPLMWQRGVARAALGKEYSVVVLGPALSSVTTWLILLGRFLMRRPTYLWGQCGRLHDRTPRRIVQELMNRLATGVLVYGEKEAASARELGLPASRVHIVFNATRHNSVSESSEDDSFERMRAATRNAQETGEVALLHVGRINRTKHLETLIEASRLLLEQFPRLRLDIVGDGDDLPILQRKYSDTHITYHGWVYDPTILNELFLSSTLVCSPFHMGLLAVDALRAGVPVLVPSNPMNASEIECLTPGVNSEPFIANDARSLADAAVRWLQRADGISREAYLSARRTQLQVWQPSNVAHRLLSSVLQVGGGG